MAGHLPEVVILVVLVLILVIAWTLWRVGTAFFDGLQGR